MKPEVARALARHAPERRRWLSALTLDERRGLLEDLISDFFVGQRRLLLKWSALTGQSAQIDTGYIAQHMASVVLGEPGQGYKGKGVDLADGSEVKSAATLSGVDRPRWNHSLGTVASDREREVRGLAPTWRGYVEAPRVFYVLFDRCPGDAVKLRVRAWCIHPALDDGWRELIMRFVRLREGRRYNLQLHPPIGKHDDLVVNELGNLDFSEVKVFEARFALPETPYPLAIDWTFPLSDTYRSGVTVTSAYRRDPGRRIELEGPDAHPLMTEAEVRALFRALRPN